MNSDIYTNFTLTSVAGTVVTSLQATFISPISGTIYFRQVGSDSNTAIWGKMYWVDDTDTTMEHNWHIHMTAVSNNLP